jgi:aromatic ring-opening dioxygenase LigB subunit
MSLTLLAAAIAPNAVGSSTMGVKKSTVATSARSGAIRYTAASSRDAVPRITLGSTIGGSAERTWPSSTGLSLQAQPAPWLYSVNRSGETFIGPSPYPRRQAPQGRQAAPLIAPASGRGGTISAVSLVFAAIAPHGGIAIAEGCEPHEVTVAAKTRHGMETLGRLFAEARPEVVIVATPHNVHVDGALGVIVSSRVSGQLAGSPSIALDLPTDADLAWRVLAEWHVAGIPCVAVSFGGNDPTSAVAPMDWGVLIPLWFMGGRARPETPIVVVTPSRDLPPDAHSRAGAAIAQAAEASGRRVALIASADHGHAHAADGPYGFDPRAKVYDELVCDIVRSDELDRLDGIDPELVEGAKADSWWQMLMLRGAVDGRMNGELITYEAPTYFGMLTAAYRPL